MIHAVSFRWPRQLSQSLCAHRALPLGKPADRYGRDGESEEVVVARWGAHGAIKDASSTVIVMPRCCRPLPVATVIGRPPTRWKQRTEGWVPIDGISAHPKVDERTGELLFFNYSKRAPYMHYGVVDKSNRLVTYVPIPLPGPRLPHDMIYTEHYSILNDFPLFWDPDQLAQGRHVVRFYPNIASRFAIIPRHGRTEDIKWFESSPTFVLHFVNAYEQGDEVIVDGYHQKNPMPESPKQAPTGYERMMVYLDQYAMDARHRWRFNLRTARPRKLNRHPGVRDDERARHWLAVPPIRRRPVPVGPVHRSGHTI